MKLMYEYYLFVLAELRTFKLKLYNYSVINKETLVKFANQNSEGAS